MTTIILAITAFALLAAIAIDWIAWSEVKEERTRNMSTWRPPGEPGRPDWRRNDRAGD